jgi:hypothetical protein
MRRARDLRQELEAATATGTDERERLVHGAITAGMEAGLVQGLEAALRGLREARDVSGAPSPRAPATTGRLERWGEGHGMKAIKAGASTSCLALLTAALLALLVLSVGVAHAQCAYDDYYCVSYAPPPARPLVLSIAAALNRDTVSVNEDLVLSAQIVNTGGAGAVTLYVVIVLPASASPVFGCGTSSALVFLADGGTAFEILCGSAPPETFPAYAENLSIDADAYLALTDVLTFLWPAGAPAGLYTFAVVATPLGGFNGGPIGPESLLAFGVDTLLAE